MKTFYTVVALLFDIASACPDHNNLRKRASSEADYSYYEAQDWGHLKEGRVTTSKQIHTMLSHCSEYSTCQIGTTQTPLRLNRFYGYASTHKPIFDYPSSAKGHLINSGTSLSYTLTDDDDYSLLPSFRFAEDEDEDAEDVYLVGWHLHAPSEHVIDGRTTRAEMHFVHNDADGNTRSVLAFLIAPSGPNGTQSAFFNQIPQPFPNPGSDDEEEFDFDPSLAIEEVGGLEKYWTYKGSLTTPPCTEGLRWFVAAQPLKVDNEMMEEILAISMFSARPTQSLWMHELNV